MHYSVSETRNCLPAEIYLVTLQKPVDLYDVCGLISASLGKIVEASRDATVAFKTNIFLCDVW